MVKLATAREIRMYGPRRAKNQWEYINAGLYLFATVILVGGLAAQFSEAGDSKSGLVVILIALGILTFVNLHDLTAHMAGIDYRCSLMEYDLQLALVEFAVPSVHALGSILNFVGIGLLLLQEEKHYDFGFEQHALNLLIAGPALWVLGSMHDLCQYYERADGHVQILQKGVQIPFLLGSLLFLVGGILNTHSHFGSTQRGLKLLSKTWVWMGIAAGLLFFIGGFINVIKVFKMQQMDGGRLEKLRGGAQEWLSRAREGQVPLILEEQRRRRIQAEEPTPYKDVLLSRP
ncbi:hypothetical protein H6P81_014460 [Aristolochia fimbriata]|uniref:Uncharacterized protein n=1 Tax=Aristolochia fimbriata TaxID=158543 RepID=A0AAV7EL74_ARIFI|nr:hypothetical protein H6P81_014460 [Aristolochia fimbriata]